MDSGGVNLDEVVRVDIPQSVVDDDVSFADVEASSSRRGHKGSQDGGLVVVQEVEVIPKDVGQDAVVEKTGRDGEIFESYDGGSLFGAVAEDDVVNM